MLIQEGIVMIFEGDALKIMASWPDGYVSSVITSPPFRDADIEGDYYLWLLAFTNECIRLSQDYAIIFNTSRRLVDICRKTDPFRVINWHKPQGQMSFRYQPIFIYRNPNARYNINSCIWNDSLSVLSVLRMKSGQISKGHIIEINGNSKNSMEKYPIKSGHHPYEDPLKLYDYLVRIIHKSGFYENGILDPCCGSGTALVASAKYGIKGIGIDKEHKYAEMARKRVQTYLGQERLAI